MFNFLHLELTSVCNKGDGTPGSGCFMCGRRKMEREHPELCDWGDMPLRMVGVIAEQTPPGTLVQLHNNGDPICYPHLDVALPWFKHCIRQFNTNGKLLLEKADEIINHLDILTISVIQDDPEGDSQYGTVNKFIERKGHRAPEIVYRLLGRVDNSERWEKLPGRIATRVLHNPDGSRDYHKPVTIPEHGICLDLLTHLAIDRHGNISMCVRFDPKGDLRLGNINEMTLQEAWDSEKRQRYIKAHIQGKRASCQGCDRCDFYGIAAS